MPCEIGDLLGRPYELGGTDPAVGVDCWWTVREVARRHFGDEVLAELPLTGSEAVELADTPDPWELLPSGSSTYRILPGDLIYGSESGRDYAAFCYERNLAISARPDRGVFRAPPSKLAGVLAVFRRRRR